MRETWRAILLALVGAALLAAPTAAEEVTFRFVPSEAWDVTTCSVRGTFNDWGETPMTKGEDGSWAVVIDLPPGEYHYKYFADGEWPRDMEHDLFGGPVDPDAHAYTDDGYSGQNAVRFVGIERPAESIPAEPPSTSAKAPADASMGSVETRTKEGSSAGAYVFRETTLGPNKSLVEVDTRTDKHVAQSALLLMCDFARLTVDKGAKYFACGEWERGEGDKTGMSSCVVAFFAAPPETVPVIDMFAEPDSGIDPETAAYNAVQVLEFCKMVGVGAPGAPRTQAPPGEVGYRIEGDHVIFEFNPREYKSVTRHTTGEWGDIGRISVATVAVAGEFNSWSRDAWLMQDAGGGTYGLVRPAGDFASTPEWLFKFVVNGDYWVEPPDHATNRVAVAPGSSNQNLVLRIR